jgi:hypothetical protein
MSLGYPSITGLVRLDYKGMDSSPRRRLKKVPRHTQDLHTALRQEVVARTNREGFEAVLARHQWSKDDVGFSLHANPSSLEAPEYKKRISLPISGSSVATGVPSRVFTVATRDG